LYEVQVSDVEERTETSVELGSRVADRAESRMLIDGELVAAAGGEEFDNVSPATGRCWEPPLPRSQRTWIAP
jgi:aldehyde dehydrogenase (NAD+)